jgi:hypothetical protein
MPILMIESSCKGLFFYHPFRILSYLCIIITPCLFSTAENSRDFLAQHLTEK